MDTTAATALTVVPTAANAALMSAVHFTGWNLLLGPLSAAASTVLVMTAIDTEQLEDQLPAGLTDDDLAMLELETSWWKYAAVKESLIRERFGISSTIYYARLNALIDQPEALAAAPMVVRRLQRLREQRRAHRSARRLNA